MPWSAHVGKTAALKLFVRWYIVHCLVVLFIVITIDQEYCQNIVKAYKRKIEEYGFKSLKWSKYPQITYDQQLFCIKVYWQTWALTRDHLLHILTKIQLFSWHMVFCSQFIFYCKIFIIFIFSHWLFTFTIFKLKYYLANQCDIIITSNGDHLDQVEHLNMGMNI